MSAVLFRKALERFRYGPGVCPVDWAFDDPAPLGGARGAVGQEPSTLEAAMAEVARSEHEAASEPFAPASPPSE